MIRHYISRLSKQTWSWATWALGILALFADIFFQGVFPWTLYPIIFGIGIIIGGYLVFKEVLEEKANSERELHRQITELENEVAKFLNSQPIVSVHLLSSAEKYSKRQVIELPVLPAKPDLGGMVKLKRDYLMEEWNNPRSTKDRSAISFMNRSPNPNFEAELEAYVIEYETYLQKLYAAKTAKLAAYFIWPIILNEGTAPAENVTVTFTMPRDFVPPTESRAWITKLVFDGNQEELEYELDPPIPPKLTVNMFNPAEYVGNFNPSVFSNMSDYLEHLENVSGPIVEHTNGGYAISYQIKKLVQHRPEKDLEPFLLWLDNIEPPVLWEIPVKIVSASLREPKMDTLYIQINPKSESD